MFLDLQVQGIERRFQPGIDIDAVLGLTGGGEGGRACPDPAGNGARAGMFAPVTPDMTPDKAPPIPPPLIKPVTMPPRPADSDFAADALVVLFEPGAAAVCGTLLGCMPKK